MNKEIIMETKTLNSPIRTKDEILAWLEAARQRKAAWEKKVDEKFSERKRPKNNVILIPSTRSGVSW